MAFLVFEGVDAAGKSTLIELLCQTLQEKQLTFVKTKEPGGTKIGEAIQKILLTKEHPDLNALTETLLYYADRNQHIKEVIQTALNKNSWVISDRYWASTSAYQCGGRGVDETFVRLLQQTVCKGCEPDLWILLDLPVEESLKRLFVTKKNKRDKIEMENSTFHQKVRDYYLKLAQQNPSKWLVLSAVQTSEQLLDQILSHLKQKNFLK